MGAVYQFLIFKKVSGATLKDFFINRNDFNLAKGIWRGFLKKKKAQ